MASNTNKYFRCGILSVLIMTATLDAGSALAGEAEITLKFPTAQASETSDEKPAKPRPSRRKYYDITLKKGLMDSQATDKSKQELSRTSVRKTDSSRQ